MVFTRTSFSLVTAFQRTIENMLLKLRVLSPGKCIASDLGLDEHLEQVSYKPVSIYIPQDS